MLRGCSSPMGLEPASPAAHEEECSRGESCVPYLTIHPPPPFPFLFLSASVQLARRVLKLERINSSLRQQLEAMECAAREKEKKLASLTEQLDLSKQPYKYLIESLKARDEELHIARSKKTALEEKINSLEEQRRKVIEVKDQLASDLERLLNHREVNPVIKV